MALESGTCFVVVAVVFLSQMRLNSIFHPDLSFSYSRNIKRVCWINGLACVSFLLFLKVYLLIVYMWWLYVYVCVSSSGCVWLAEVEVVVFLKYILPTFVMGFLRVLLIWLDRMAGVVVLEPSDVSAAFWKPQVWYRHGRQFTHWAIFPALSNNISCTSQGRYHHPPMHREVITT